MAAPNLLYLFFLTLLLLLTFSSLANPMPSRRRHEASAAASSGERQYQVLDLKKMRPYVLASSDRAFAKIKNVRRRARQGKMVQVKRPAPAAKEWGSRPFSAMLPKGYVPPSGSSSCHNAFPSSIDFYCGESANDP